MRSPLCSRSFHGHGHILLYIHLCPNYTHSLTSCRAKYEIKYWIMHTRKLASALAFNDAEIAYYKHCQEIILTRFLFAAEIESCSPREKYLFIKVVKGFLYFSASDAGDYTVQGDKKINFAINIDARSNWICIIRLQTEHVYRINQQ